MKRYAKQKEKKLNFTKIFCEKYLEKIEIVGTGNDGNSDFDVLDAIGKIEFLMMWGLKSNKQSSL